MEETLAIVKPDVFGKIWYDNLLEKNDEEPPEVDEEDEDAEPPPMPEPWKKAPEVRSADMTVNILERIERAGFEVAARKTVQLTTQDAAAFYAEHKGRPFFEGLIAHMSSGPSLVLKLRKENAIKDWRALQGPTNPDAAREAAEAANPLDDTDWSLRALFGDSGPRNATHGSDSPFSALRETNFFFPPNAPQYERSFAVLSGAAASAVDATVAALETAGFIVVAQAKDSANMVGLVVEGDDAVRALQLWAHANNKDVQPASSVAEAVEKQDSFFSEPLPLERTLAIIKPGVAASHGETISRELRRRGFTVLAETRTRLTPQDAATLLSAESHSPTFASNVRYLSSGAVVALALSKPAALASLNAAMGPASSAEARREQPHTIRGRFGIDDVGNAIHGSSSAEAANSEICFFFPHLHPTPMLTGDAAKAYITEKQIATVSTPMGEVPASLHTTLVQGLTELCKSKPTGLAAVEWLGNWLLENNPASGPAPSAPAASMAEGVEESKEATVVAPPAASATGAPNVVFFLGGDSTASTLCARLAKRFHYTVIDAETESKAADADKAVAGVKEAIAKAPSSNFIVRGFPSTLDQAFLFERTCAQPIFVLNDGDDGEVAEFYSKLGLSHPITGEGDAAFESAAKWFQPRVVYMLGKPGSRRTELAHAACDQYGYTYMSLEGLVRAEAESGSRFGRDLADIIARGDQLPMEHILRLFREAVEVNPTGCFVVDGFPRTQEQANALSRELAMPQFVLHLDCPDDECLRREGAAARKGIRVFNGRTAAYVANAAALGLVRSIDADRPAAQVYADVQAAFNPEVVFMLGGPGCGKGTQSARLVRDFGYVHLSAGDLLRAEVARQSPEGELLNDYMRKGQLVPVEVTLSLLSRAMAKSAASRLIIDGFPRANDQAMAFDSSVCEPQSVVFLDADDATLMARIASRAKTSGRVDDDPAVIQSRLNTFHTQSKSVIERYAEHGKVIVLDGTQSVDDVTAALSARFQPRVVVATGGANAGVAAQCARVSSQFGYMHINVDKLVQAEIALGTVAGERLEKMVKADDVPAAELLSVISSTVARSGARKVLLEGFPRNDEEAGLLETTLRPSSWLHIDNAADTRPAGLAEAMKQYTEEGRLFAVKSDGASADGVFAEVRKVFQPELVVLVGATGSGRGEFCRRAGKQLGYARLRLTHLLKEEAASGSSVGRTIARALAARRTVPVDAVMSVLRAAIARSSATRFLLDGYPRVVSDGFPSVQDQVFAMEEQLGPVRGVIVLEASTDIRRSRVAPTLSSGQERELSSSVEAYQREKLAVLTFFGKLGKVHRVDTSRSAEDVYTDAAPFIE